MHCPPQQGELGCPWQGWAPSSRGAGPGEPWSRRTVPWRGRTAVAGLEEPQGCKRLAPGPAQRRGSRGRGPDRVPGTHIGAGRRPAGLAPGPRQGRCGVPGGAVQLRSVDRKVARPPCAAGSWSHQALLPRVALAGAPGASALATSPGHVLLGPCVGVLRCPAQRSRAGPHGWRSLRLPRPAQLSPGSGMPRETADLVSHGGCLPAPGHVGDQLERDSVPWSGVRTGLLEVPGRRRAYSLLPP